MPSHTPHGSSSSSPCITRRRSYLPLASRTRWHPARSALWPRLPAAIVALTRPSLAIRLPAPACGSAATVPRLCAVPAPVLAGAPYRRTE